MFCYFWKTGHSRMSFITHSVRFNPDCPTFDRFYLYPDCPARVLGLPVRLNKQTVQLLWLNDDLQYCVK